MSRLRLIVVALLCFPAAAPAVADDGPFLRIETGVHEAAINRLALMPDGLAMVTASDDKTARIWSRADLTPQAVLRPPIGAGDDGALYAVAVSPHVIAMSGRITDEAGKFGIAFFATDDRRPIGVISGLPAAVLALAFSRVGDSLAVGLQNGAGLRVIDLKSMRTTVADTDYSGDVTWVAFDGEGRLAVAAEDGKVRIYSPDHQRLAALPLPGQAKPWGVAFSPDGGKLAIGDRIRPVVHLLDVTKLHFEHDLAGAPRRGGGLNVVAFSPDGHSLYAAGSYVDEAGQLFVHRWDLVSHTAVDIPASRDLITDLLPVAGGVVFSTAEPSLGRLDEAGHLVAVRHPRHINLHNSPAALRLSQNGMQVALPVRAVGDAAAAAHVLFDAQTHDLLNSDTSTTDLAEPMTAAHGLRVTDWQNNHSPRLNGQMLKLEPAETARAVAVASDGTVAAIGTDFFVRLAARVGELWRTPTGTPVTAVNISRDNRLVVAALGDGTIHWYSASSGHELLGLFIDPSTRRWVLWTPEGFFDHDHRDDGASDGRTLIGYRFNLPSGRSSAFVEIGQLYPLFFRPDLVGLSLRDDAVGRDQIVRQYALLGDVKSVLAGGLPPRIRLIEACGATPGGSNGGCAGATTDIAHPSDHPDADFATMADSVRVRYRLFDPSGRVGSVLLHRNDAVVTPTIAIDSTEDRSRIEEATVPLGRGINVLRIVPLSNTGAVEASASGDATIRVFRSQPPAPPPPDLGGSPQNSHEGAPLSTQQDVAQAAVGAPAAPRVTLYVVSVGVSQFAAPFMADFNLDNPDKDAKAVGKLMSTASPPIYDDVDVTVLPNSDATSTNIIAALKNVAAKARPDDLVLIFFAGHGEEVDGKYYFAAADLGEGNQALIDHIERASSDAAASQATDVLFRSQGLGQDQILSLIQAVQANKLALILDTCYSATVAVQDAVIRRDLNSTVTNKLGHAAGRFVLSSAYATAHDYAPGNAATPAAALEQHGLFTEFLLRALQGEADFDGTHRIDIYKLAMFTKRNVLQQSEALVKQDPKEQVLQEPAYYFAGNDFFALRATDGTAPKNVAAQPPAPPAVQPAASMR